MEKCEKVRVWTKDEIKDLIERNNTMVGRSIVKLYEHQTYDEQNTEQTIEVNGVGFNGVDAPIMTSFALYYKKNGFLTDKQLTIARKKLPKYAMQLTNIANGVI